MGLIRKEVSISTALIDGWCGMCADRINRGDIIVPMKVQRSIAIPGRYGDTTRPRWVLPKWRHEKCPKEPTTTQE